MKKVKRSNKAASTVGLGLGAVDRKSKRAACQQRILTEERPQRKGPGALDALPFIGFGSPPRPLRVFSGAPTRQRCYHFNTVAFHSLANLSFFQAVRVTEKRIRREYAVETSAAASVTHGKSDSANSSWASHVADIAPQRPHTVADREGAKRSWGRFI